ncbi:MAG: tetraacyldisaccharide 4'-kinase [Rhodospirillaceae bacterium]
MKAPGFWYRDGASPQSVLLTPAGWIYGWATAVRLRSGHAVDPGVPVVCVGNLTAGGAGKTPVVRDIARRLASAGRNACVISKGYGARDRGAMGTAPTLVDAAHHTAAQVGDEPVMLARAGISVRVGMDRPQAARAAVGTGAQALILDDGYQDLAVAKTVSLVVVDGGLGFGNEALIPAGPLREPVATGLTRADGVVIAGEDRRGIEARVRAAGFPDMPVLTAHVRPGPELAHIKDRPVFAFAGIGHPEKFFQTLEAGGCGLAGREAFADHHPFSDAEIARIKRTAAALGARPVTTEKDLVRLGPDQAAGIEVLTITLEWDDEAALTRLLAPVLS